MKRIFMFLLVLGIVYSTCIADDVTSTPTIYYEDADVNADGMVNISDIVTTINKMAAGETEGSGDVKLRHQRVAFDHSQHQRRTHQHT